MLLLLQHVHLLLQGLLLRLQVHLKSLELRDPILQRLDPDVVLLLPLPLRLVLVLVMEVLGDVADDDHRDGDEPHAG